MIKILFLIHDLGQGGAEKVLVNLVNNMDPTKFDISVISLFGGGVNEQFLAPHIHYRTVWKKAIPGNSKLMKLLSPKQLHKLCIKEHYDIEVSYLEGPSARIISGCPHKDTKLVSWIHTEFQDASTLSAPFRSKNEALQVYNRFHQTVCVSQNALFAFRAICAPTQSCCVLYNTVESDRILSLAAEAAPEINDSSDVRLIAVGTLNMAKGYDCLLHIMGRLKKVGVSAHLYILGIGPLQKWIEAYIRENNLTNTITLLGYQTNPYRYLRQCDLFVCASRIEGFSTAATEALIVGTPVCTVEVSGMKEMLGENNEYGIVTENNEDALYEGIKRLLDDPALLKHYAEQAAIRGKNFRTEETVRAVETMLLSL